MKTLYIHPRKGLYQLTKCQKCGHTWGCQNCDAKLTTYRQSGGLLELLCHQCQSYYQYPSKCPECNSTEISSKYGGIDELVEELEKNLETIVIRLDKSIKIQEIENQNNTTFVTTRVFDPAIPYPKFERIVFYQSQNLLASPDYLVQEETMKGIAEVLLKTGENTEVIFETNSKELDLFQELMKLNSDHQENEDIYNWFLKFLDKEKNIRQKYKFPPFYNLLLITTQEKFRDRSLQSLVHVKDYLNKISSELPGVSWSDPYPARFLKRKNLYSHHLLLKYPRQYENFRKLRSEIASLAELYNLQVRLNPRHLF